MCTKLYDGLYTGLQSRWISSDSDSDSDSNLKISTPTPTPNPLRLLPSKGNSISKGPTCCSHFLHFHFDCIQKGEMAIQHPFALAAHAAGRGYR